FHTDRWRRARVVDAGPDQTLDAGFPVMTTLAGAIDDSGGSLGTFTTVWEQISGPGAAAFADDAALSTQVALPEPGTYHFRLLAQGDVDRCDVVRVVAVDTGAGLELHLTFDAGDGADASGNGRDGTLSGGPSALADGRVGGGLSFDGQDDAVIVPDFDYGDEWTVALWMRADDLTGVGYQYVASHNGFDLQPSFNFYLPETAATLMEDPGDLLSPQQPQAPAVNGFTGRARAAVRDGNDGPGQFSTASAPVDDGGWHHLILTVPAGGGHRVVVDGLDLAGGSHGGAAFDPPGDLFFGGRSVAPAGRYFDGDLDEIRLYSRGLLDEEVAMLSSEDDANAVPFVDAGDDLSIYQPGGAVVEGVAVDDGPLTLEWSQVDGPGLAAFAEPGSAVSGVTFDQVGSYTLRLTVDDGTTEVSDDVDVAVLTESEPGLVGRWAFSASGGAVAFDTSGLAQDGQLTGTPAAPTWTLGQRGNALHFDGTQNQAVIIPGSPLLDPRPQRDDFSILLWLRVDPGAEGSIISRGSSEVSARQFQIFLLDPNNDGVSDLTAVVGGLTNDQPKQLGERVDDGRWRHVALVHDAMALTNQFFIDGVAIGAAVPSGTATQDLSLLIGARRVDADDTGIGFPLTGAVDDVRFYTRALTAQDIQDVLSEPFCTDADCIFGDGFESGDVSAWDSCFGDCL
ncbi:MAG: LamG-like jellyroll fold domain-containing protein, partial [Acidobacteriota bacterium]